MNPVNTRIAEVRVGMATAGCDAFVSIHPPTNQYLSGFLTSFIENSSAILVTETDALFLCDSRYIEQARGEVQGLDVEQIDGPLAKAAGERLHQLGVAKAAFDPAGFTIQEWGEITELFGGDTCPLPDLVSSQRRVKSREEVGLICEASELAEGVLADILPLLKPGVSEREIAARFEYEFKRRGASGASFDTLVLFGPRSSLPHGQPGDTRLKRGDVILLDFGCRRRGYCSDLTRTYAFGTIPGTWYNESYELVLAAQAAALDAIRPGVTCRELDAVARTVIVEAGYGDLFGHGLGHGVGIEIHEAPSVNKRTADRLIPGMVITVEPGVYLPGQGGIRIEDLVVVTEDGCDLLSSTPKELTVIQ